MYIKPTSIAVILCLLWCVPAHVQNSHDDDHEKQVRISARERARYDFFEEHMAPIKNDPSLYAAVFAKIHTIVKTVITGGMSFVFARLILALLCRLPWIRDWIASVEGLYAKYTMYQKVSTWGKSFVNVVRERRRRFCQAIQNCGSRVPMKSPEELFPSSMKWPDFTSTLGKLRQERASIDEMLSSYVISIITFLCPLVFKLLSRWAEKYDHMYTKIITAYVAKWPEYKVGTPQQFHKLFEILYGVFIARGKKLEINEKIAERLVTRLVMESIDARLAYEM
jgi:hypothetical protein